MTACRRGTRSAEPQASLNGVSERKNAALLGAAFVIWVREQDLNLRPSGYEPDELPGCSIPRQMGVL